MSKTSKLLILSLLLFSFSCSHKIYVYSTKPEQVKQYLPNYVTFYLPQTKIKVELEAERIVRNKGPFANYAKKYLGNLKNIIYKNSTHWKIIDVNISTQPVRDTNNLWVVWSNSQLPFLINLSPQGYILSINKPVNYNWQRPQTQVFVKASKLQDSSDYFSIVDQGYKEVYDTVFRTVKYDTIQRTVPIIKSKEIAKSPQEQAKDLANAIFDLQDQRMSLVSGDLDMNVFPDGQALQEMLKGIDKLENKYLALFVGHVDKSIFHYSFDLVPQYKNVIYEQIIFRFSDKIGVLPAKDLRGAPIILEIRSSESTRPLKTFNQNQNLLHRIQMPKFNQKGIPYRIPEIADVYIKYKGKILAHKKVQIAQFGTLGYIPISLLKKRNIQIEYYPNTGALKSIERTK